MIIYSFDVGDITKNSNTVKEVLLAALERDGLLTKPAVDVAANYAVVIYEQSWMGKLFSKVTGGDEKSLKIQVMKIV